MPEPDYDQACKQAATNQGLDPIGALLTEAGIPWNLEQTGGFVMVINVDHVDETFYLWITSSGTEEAPLALVGMYDASDGELLGDSEGNDEAYDEVPFSALVELINERRNS